MLSWTVREMLASAGGTIRLPRSKTPMHSTETSRYFFIPPPSCGRFPQRRGGCESGTVDLIKLAQTSPMCPRLSVCTVVGCLYSAAQPGPSCACDPHCDRTVIHAYILAPNNSCVNHFIVYPSHTPCRL